MTMNRYIVALLGFLFAAPASAADSTVSSMTAASALGGTELIYCIQSGADRKCTPAQLSTYVQSLISGDCTISGNVITCSMSVPVNPQTGSNYAILTGDRGKLVNLSNASPQIPTIAAAGSTGFAAGWFTNACNQGAGTQTVTPTTSTIGGASTYVLAAGSAAAPVCVGIVSDGTNYQVVPGITTNASLLSSGTVNAARLPFGTGVGTAAAANLSAAGGLTSTIASGTATLGTSAISSAACATVVTVTATNVATTDVVNASFNGDPTAVTGYVPLTSGMLTIIGYPTANNVNFKVCNNTSSSVTPGAITLNWRVAR